ncbi:MAG: isocitrate lyase/phosphoenolpyruvate mutase family protein [Candidatus Micrarchaeota archaeon]
MTRRETLTCGGIGSSNALHSKARRLRRLFAKKGVIRIVGAHNGLTARLVEKNGFDGVWASGFEISTSHGVPDASILTMTQFLQAASGMNEAVSIPVIADCDNGFGDVNNTMHAVAAYERAGIAGVVIEDKRFPKINSFVDTKHDLVSISEFVGKIRAAKHSQKTTDFMVFARVEALIAGMDFEEAMMRAEAYSEAGADGIFIHSKSRDSDEIIEFTRRWKRRTPLIVCPTKYISFTLKEMKRLRKIKMVIYANHVVRSAIKSINENLSILSRSGDLREIEDRIVSVEEVLELQGMEKLVKTKKLFGGR